jgi:type I restriction enzyme S subunit
VIAGSYFSFCIVRGLWHCDVADVSHVVNPFETLRGVCRLCPRYRLRQSVLKRGFEGKLVPQDPNDEPASVLLERIRAERAKMVPPIRRVKRSQRVKAVAVEVS